MEKIKYREIKLYVPLIRILSSNVARKPPSGVYGEKHTIKDQTFYAQTESFRERAPESSRERELQRALERESSRESSRALEREL